MAYEKAYIMKISIILNEKAVKALTRMYCRLHILSLEMALRLATVNEEARDCSILSAG